jgi:hypothetical protein
MFLLCVRDGPSFDIQLSWAHFQLYAFFDLFGLLVLFVDTLSFCFKNCFRYFAWFFVSKPCLFFFFKIGSHSIRLVLLEIGIVDGGHARSDFT